jgi:hypothetical protein
VDDTPVEERYDVVYLLDGRGWYYRYSHMHTIDSNIVPGRMISMGDRIGVLGKEGGSGGWTHLHFEAKARQPNGKWGTEDGYAYIWQSYIDQYRPKIIAVARPHHLIRTGDSVELDGSRSWAASGKIAQYRWKFCDGTTAEGPRVTRKYDGPGYFAEVLEVRDEAGNVSYDSCIVQVNDPQGGRGRGGGTMALHPVYFPTMGIKVGDEVTFKVRSMRGETGERWDFGDGSPTVEVVSDLNVERYFNSDARKYNPLGYAATTHRFEKPGTYVVRVERTKSAAPSIGHLFVTVE